MIETMELVKKQGKTRFIGVSTHDPNAMVDFILKVGKFDAVQTTYSYAIGAPFRDAAIAKLHNAGIGVIAMKVVIATATPKGDQGNHLTNEGGLAAIKWVLRNPGNLDHRAVCGNDRGSRDELPGHDGEIHPRGRKNTFCAQRRDTRALLPHVFRVQGEMPQGRAGRR